MPNRWQRRRMVVAVVFGPMKKSASQNGKERNLTA
jgi:hypothetical protein